MKEFFEKTFTELTTEGPLEIHNHGDAQLTTLFSIVNYRFENLLPTTTHTNRKPFELCKAISGDSDPDFETLAYAIVGRLWEMGVERSSRAAAQS